MYHSLDLTTHYLLEQSGVSKAKTKYYYLNMQQYGSHPTQLFNIRLARKSNGDIEQGVYKIYSHQYSGMLLSLSDGVCHNNTDILLWNEKNQPYEKWNGLHHQNSCVPTAYVPHGIYMLYPRHIPTVYQGCICRGYMMWRTSYAVGYMPWGTMSMLPTPYAYAVWNTYSVDDVLYDVGGYSVGDMP